MGLLKFLKSCAHGPYEFETLIWKYHLKCKLGSTKTERQELIKVLNEDSKLFLKPYDAKDGKHFYVCNAEGQDIGILLDDITNKLNRLYPLAKYDYQAKINKIFQDTVTIDSKYDDREWTSPLSWMCSIKIIVTEKIT